MAWQTLDQQYGQQTDRNDRSNYLKDIIAGLSIANNNDPQTLLGYGIGRLLSNYVNRGLERRQQDKNQEAYDKWIQGKNGIKGEELMPMLKGTPIVNENASPKQDYSFANQIADQMSGRDYVKEAMAANGINTDGNFFPAPQPQQETQQDDVKQAVRSIASEIAARPTVDRRYNMSSDEIYQNAYNIARKNGSTEDQARKFAQQQAGLYQSQRVQSLSDQFLNGGVNPDGTINNQGVATLAQLAQENPNQTNMLGNMYLNPQAQAKNAQDIAKMMMNSDLHLRNTLQAQQQAADLREQAAQAAFGRQWDMLNARQQMEIDQKMRLAGILSSAAGLSPQEAILSAFGAGGGRGRSGGGDNGGEKASATVKMLREVAAQIAKTGYDETMGEWRNPEAQQKYNAYMRMIDDIVAGKAPASQGENGLPAESDGGESDDKFNTNDYQSGIRLATRLLDYGRPKEAVAKYILDNWGDMGEKIVEDAGLGQYLAKHRDR